MKVQQMLNSMEVVQKLSELRLPIKKAHQMFLLMKKFDEHREFFMKEEKQIVTNCNGTISEDGRITFPTVEDQNDFIVAHNEFLQYDFDNGENEIIELSFNDLSGIQLTPLEIMKLEGVINFVD